MNDLVKKRCERCLGQGWFEGPWNKQTKKKQPDEMCGQCNSHGFVYAQPAIGGKAPRVMQGQQTLDG